MKAQLYHGRIEVTGETEDEINFIMSLFKKESFQTRVVKPTDDEGALLRFYFKDKNGDIIY